MIRSRSTRIRLVRSKSTTTSKFIPDELRSRHKYFSKSDLGTSDDSNRLNLTKNLLKSTGKDYTRAKGNYFDPANAKLNLSLNNSVLYDKISGATKDRTAKRFETPSKEWKETLRTILDTSDKKHSEKTRKKIHSAIQNATISSEVINDSTNIGDLVTLYDDNVNLYLIVEIPESLTSSSYTFINNEGEVVYAKRSAIKVRFPRIIPQEYHPIIRSFVQLEKKHLDIQPIGVANDKFSKSDESLPQELRKGNGQNKAELETLNVNDSTSEGLHEDFLVAQASSQFLTNSNVNTYQVPIEARKFYSKALTEVSIKTFNQLSLVNTKLEVLHRKLQYDNNGDVINSPRTISIFEILYHLENTDLTSLHDRTLSVSHLGKDLVLANDFETQKYPISTFLALIISLRKQARLWNIDKYNKSYPPISVTILPIKNVELTNKVVRYLKFRKGDVEFANYFIDRSQKKPQYYDETIQMFKDYIIGNFTSDPVLETLLVSIIRLVDSKLDKVSSSYAYEYSKARAYDLLASLESKELENPSNWSKSIQLSDESSIMSKFSGDYYKFVDKHVDENKITSDAPVGVSDFFGSDPLASLRENFDTIPVYCIDSADAHEIDDGISIHQDGDDYVISTHIADPASFIKPTSIISSIAFNKGRTTYLPEGPSMMLPKLIPNISGLGINGQETRTFVIQYRVNKALIDEFISKKLTSEDYKLQSKFLTDIHSQIKSSIQIKAGYAKNFPEGFTYSKVDQILKDKELIQNYEKGNSKDVHFDNLFRLYNISTILHNVRVMIGEGTQFMLSKSTLKVNESKTDSFPSFNVVDGGYEISLNPKQTIQIISNTSQGIESRSQLLVSEFMIFANHCSATFARDKGIDIVYRSQEMILNSEVKQSIHKIIKQSIETKQGISEEDLSKILSVLTSAKTQTIPKRHESLGVDAYTNVTSPLRRYTDILNHWKFEEYLMKKSESNHPELSELQISKSNLQYISNHLQNTELINNQIQRFSLKFWEGMFFREYLKLLYSGKIPKKDQIRFRLLVRSSPKNDNYVLVDVLGFNNLHSKLEITPRLMKEFSEGSIKVGHILDSDSIVITKVDFIEDELVLEYR